MPSLSKYSRKTGWFQTFQLLSIFCASALLLSVLTGFFIPFVPLSFILVPIAAIYILAVLLIPSVDRNRDVLLWILFLSFLSLWLIWPQYISIIRLPGDPWLSPQRILIYCILLFAGYEFSVSRYVRASIRESYNDSNILFKAILVFTMVLLLGLPFSTDVSYSLQYVLKFGYLELLVFLIAASLVKNTPQMKSLQWVLLGGAGVLSILSIIEFMVQQNIWQYLLPDSIFYQSDVFDEVVFRTMFRGGLYRVKASSITALEHAELLSLILPFAFHLLFEQPGRMNRFAGLVLSCLIITSVILTQSRLGLVAMVVATLAYFLLFSFRLRQEDPKDLIGNAMLVLVTACAVFGLALVATSGRVAAIFLGGGSLASSTNARFDQLEMGIPLIFNRPLIGHGYMQSADVLQYYDAGGFLTIDSFWLSLLLETGMIGTLAFGTMLIAGSLSAARTYLTNTSNLLMSSYGICLASSLLGFTVIKLVLSQRSNHTLVFVFLGLAVSLAKYRSVTAGRSIANIKPDN